MSGYLYHSVMIKFFALKDIHSLVYFPKVVASENNWIEGNSIQQLEATAKLKGIKMAVGLPDLHAGKGYPVGAAFLSKDWIYPALVGNDIDALLMAIWKRKLDKGLIWHTDRGSQYTSHGHHKILKDHHIIQSMSRKGDCWDNAVAESFFHTLRTELTHHHKFTLGPLGEDREEAKHVIFEYIEVFYNRIRIH